MNKTLFVLLCIGACKALTELEPINDEEKKDEVAQAQQRSVWLACLFIAYNKLGASAVEIDETAKESVYSLKDIRKKLAADILEKCASKITWVQAEKLLADEELTIENEVIQMVSEINLNQFQEKFVFSQSQLDLLKEIENFMNAPVDPVPNPPVINSTGVQGDFDFVYICIGLLILGMIPVAFLLKKPSKVPVAPRHKKQR